MKMIYQIQTLENNRWSPVMDSILTLEDAKRYVIEYRHLGFTARIVEYRVVVE